MIMEAETGLMQLQARNIRQESPKLEEEMNAFSPRVFRKQLYQQLHFRLPVSKTVTEYISVVSGH